MTGAVVEQSKAVTRIQRHVQVGVHALELGVVVLQLTKLRQVRGRHARELTLPLAVGLFADAVLSACLADLGAHLDFLEDADYLRFAESGFLHVETPSGGGSLLPGGSGFQGDFTDYLHDHRGRRGGCGDTEWGRERAKGALLGRKRRGTCWDLPMTVIVCTVK